MCHTLSLNGTPLNLEYLVYGSQMTVMTVEFWHKVPGGEKIVYSMAREGKNPLG